MPDYPVPKFATDCVHYTTRVVNYSPGIHVSTWYNAGNHTSVPECDLPTNGDMFRRPIAAPCDGCPWYEHRVDISARAHFRVLDAGVEQWGLDASGFEIRELAASAPAGDRPYAVADTTVGEVGTLPSRPLYANLCLDRSESVEDWMGTVRQSAQVWVERQWGLSDATDPRPDLTGVFSFGATASQEQALSADRDDLTASIEAVESTSDGSPSELTAMFDAIQAALDDIIIGGLPNCNAIVVIGDGVDTCSTTTAADLITAAGAAGVPIHAVEILGALSPTTTLYELTSGTGGSLATGVVGFTGVIDFFDTIQRAGHRRYYSAAWDTKVGVANVGCYQVNHVGGLAATGRQYGDVV